MSERKIKALPGRNLYIMAAGVAILFHAGVTVSSMREGPKSEVAIPLQVLLQIILGGLVSLYGCIGRLEPIRVNDAPRPRWETLHSRPDFMVFHSRTTVLADFIEDAVALPPGVKEN